MDDDPTLTPDRILETGLGFFASKTLLSAVELGLFTELDGGSRTADELAKALDLHPRSRDDFLDALVALGFLGRDDSGAQPRYENTPETQLFLVRTSPAYVGGMLEMANARLYPFWGSLTEALRTGKPQSEASRGEKNIFEALAEDPAQLEQFLSGMQGIQMGNFVRLSEVFDFSSVSSVVDVGGANGALSIVLAERHPHLELTTFDLPPATEIARANVTQHGLDDRITAVAGDFFADDLPAGDVLVMGNILHDWDENQKIQLIEKAHQAVSSGGAFIAIENVIDDERRTNVFGLLMSLNMLIELEGGFDYTGAQFDRWCRDAGFASTEVVALAGPSSAAIARK